MHTWAVLLTPAPAQEPPAPPMQPIAWATHTAGATVPAMQSAAAAGGSVSGLWSQGSREPEAVAASSLGRLQSLLHQQQAVRRMRRLTTCLTNCRPPVTPTGANHPACGAASSTAGCAASRAGSANTATGAAAGAERCGACPMAAVDAPRVLNTASTPCFVTATGGRLSRHGLLTSRELHAGQLTNTPASLTAVDCVSDDQHMRC